MALVNYIYLHYNNTLNKKEKEVYYYFSYTSLFLFLPGSW